jgi:hypothetical protein
VAIIKIARFWPGIRRSPAQGKEAGSAVVAVDPDGLSAFGSEGGSVKTRGALALAPQLGTAAEPRPKSAVIAAYRVPLQWFLVILVTAAVVGGGMWAYQRRILLPAAPSQLTLETTPPGLEVVIGGQVMGRTPLTLPLAAGNYEVQLGTGPQQRVIQASLAAGTSVVRHVEIATVAAVTTGSLHVQTEPTRLQVRVDGVDKGISPLTIAELAPGDHQVVVGDVRRNVTVKANETVSLIVSAVDRPSTALGGWLTVASPLVLQMRESGKVIGSTDMDRVMLPSGDHTIELVNEALGYRAQRRVSIAAGRTANLTIDAPKGTLSINAQPWAEVWLDGERLGETPIGNFSTPIGSHELVFRHPEFGERRETVLVGVKQPARIGVDMRRK